MRINIVGGSNSLYYILKDHASITLSTSLGSASVVTDSTGAIVGEQGQPNASHLRDDLCLSVYQLAIFTMIQYKYLVERRYEMALDTLEKLLRQADRLTPDEQLILATRLIERARQAGRPMRASDLFKSGLVGVWSKRQDIEDSIMFARKLRRQAQRRGRAS